MHSRPLGYGRLKQLNIEVINRTNNIDEDYTSSLSTYAPRVQLQRSTKATTTKRKAMPCKYLSNHYFTFFLCEFKICSTVEFSHVIK